MRFSIALGTVLFFSACNFGWPEEYKTQFLQTCRQEAAQTMTDTALIGPYCQCVLEKIMKKAPDVNYLTEHPDSVAAYKNEILHECLTGVSAP